MDQTIDIKITCPIKIHNEIEEHCINSGINLSDYFLSLHKNFKLNREDQAERGGQWKEEPEETEAPATKKKGGKK